MKRQKQKSRRIQKFIRTVFYSRFYTNRELKMINKNLSVLIMEVNSLKNYFSEVLEKNGNTPGSQN